MMLMIFMMHIFFLLCTLLCLNIFFLFRVRELNHITMTDSTRGRAGEMPESSQTVLSGLSLPAHGQGIHALTRPPNCQPAPGCALTKAGSKRFKAFGILLEKTKKNKKKETVNKPSCVSKMHIDKNIKIE